MRIPIEKILSASSGDHGVDKNLVADLTALIEHGATILPVVVFTDPGGRHWLADGYCRLLASRKAGQVEIEAQGISGTKADAVSYRDGALRAQGRR